jgi:hypothetical protein
MKIAFRRMAKSGNFVKKASLEERKEGESFTVVVLEVDGPECFEQASPNER